MLLYFWIVYRELHTHKVVLSEDEMKVYAKLQEFASTKLKAFLKQQGQKISGEFTNGGRVSDLRLIFIFVCVQILSTCF